MKVNALRQQANIVNEAEVDEPEYLFVATYLDTSKKKLNWVMDSGCLYYMSFNKE